jgi:type IV secretion system protein TrbL
MMGLTTFFSHIVTVLVLLFAWIVVILSFFLLAVQLFITIIEFKLTTLAGFTLVPFALWNKTAFLAERVLGNVIASGIKVMVLAVIIGIGATFFWQFISALQGRDPTLADAMSLVLASISLFGLGIFGPGIATGLVSGAPQLGAGAAIGTAGALIGAGALAGGAVVNAARIGGGGLVAIRAASASPSASSANAPPPAPPPASNSASTSTTGSTSETPAWAKKMQRGQRMAGRTRAIGQAIKEGDKPGHGANPELDGGQG